MQATIKLFSTMTVQYSDPDHEQLQISNVLPQMTGLANNPTVQ
jgi:hypothetical protein